MMQDTAHGGGGGDGGESGGAVTGTKESDAVSADTLNQRATRSPHHKPPASSPHTAAQLSLTSPAGAAARSASSGSGGRAEPSDPLMDKISGPPPAIVAPLRKAGGMLTPMCARGALAAEASAGVCGKVAGCIERTLPVAIRRDIVLVWWAVLGLGLAFFGRASLWAAVVVVEAARLCGLREIREYTKQLSDDYGRRAAEAPSGHDAQAAALEAQLSAELAGPQARASQRADIMLTSVRDPDKLSGMCRAGYLLIIGVIAALRFQLARDIVIGCAIAAAVRRPAARYVASVLHHLLPERHHRWLPTGAVAIIVAACVLTTVWFAHDAAVSVAAAVRGAPLFIRSVYQLLHGRGLVQQRGQQQTDTGGWVVAGMGASCQLFFHWSMPAVLAVPLLPIVVANSAAMWLA